MSTSKVRLALIAGLVLLCGSAVLMWRSHSGNGTESPSNMNTRITPKIDLTSVMVDDQDKALKFYTEVLGFVKKIDLPTGEPGGARWLTVVSPEELEGTELLLEPMGFPPARTYQKALFEAGIPLTGFASADVRKHFERLKQLGVKFSTEPTTLGTTTIAVFDDTCGNRIQIFQSAAASNTLAAPALRIKLSSVMVDDQDKALKFYTDVLGFVKKRDMQVGSGRWLTVVSPEAPDGTELVLEPTGFAPARAYQTALREAGIPLTQFTVGDIQGAYESLTGRGGAFRGKPTKMGPATMAMLEDTCGNVIVLVQK